MNWIKAVEDDRFLKQRMLIQEHIESMGKIASQASATAEVLKELKPPATEADAINEALNAIRTNAHVVTGILNKTLEFYKE